MKTIKRIYTKDIEFYQNEILRLISKNLLKKEKSDIVVKSYVGKKIKELYANVKHSNTRIFGAVEDNILKGMICATESSFRDDKNRIYVNGIYSDEQDDWKTLIRFLLAEVEKEALKNDFDSVYFKSDFYNEELINSLENYGYEIERVHLSKSKLSYSDKNDDNIIVINHQLAKKFRNELIDLFYINTKAHILTKTFDLEWVTNKIDELINYIKTNKALVVGYIKENELVGFMWTFPFLYNNEEIYMTNAIVVFPEFRKLKIASKLFKHTESIIYKEQKKLHTYVDMANIGAFYFYKKHGMQEEKLQVIKRVNYE